MNFPSPPSWSSPCIQVLVLESAAEDICFETMKDSVDGAVSINVGVRDIAVAIDETWHKRGHKSLNGVVTRDKAVDASKRCKAKHLTTCIANYRGSCARMEIQGAVEISKIRCLHSMPGIQNVWVTATQKDFKLYKT